LSFYCPQKRKGAKFNIVRVLSVKIMVILATLGLL
jgi:hypothetical protein